jgi:cytochrome c-type biogenesis protein CcmH
VTSPLFWTFAAGLLVIAVAILLVPRLMQRGEQGRRSLGTLLWPLAIVPVSVGLYFFSTSYDPELDYLRGRNPADLAELEQLAARLGANPEDPAGWVLLGRSYLELGDYERARQALQEAWDRTPSPDTALRLSYAQALLLADARTGVERAGELLDQVVAAEPGNQEALWLGGLVAVQRGRPAVAIERWNALLATNPPPDVAAEVRGYIDQLTAATSNAGGRIPAGGDPGAAGSSPGSAAAAAGPVLSIDIAVAPAMPVADLGPNAIVYLLARSPDGGPPLAAKQIPLSALPGRFELGVADAMLPGRTIAGHERVTVIARISLSGVATEQPGDIYGQVEVDVASGEPVTITIDSVVPSA